MGASQQGPGRGSEDDLRVICGQQPTQLVPVEASKPSIYYIMAASTEEIAQGLKMAEQEMEYKVDLFNR